MRTGGSRKDSLHWAESGRLLRGGGMQARPRGTGRLQTEAGRAFQVEETVVVVDIY